MHKTQILQNNCVLASLGIENIQMSFVEDLLRKKVKYLLKYQGSGNVASQYVYSPYQADCFAIQGVCSGKELSCFV